MIPRDCKRLAEVDFPIGLIQRECHWLDMVTGYVHATSREAAQSSATKSQLQEPIKDPARFEWHEACLPRREGPRRRQVTTVAHYYLSVDALTKPMQVREESLTYGKRN